MAESFLPGVRVIFYLQECTPHGDLLEGYSWSADSYPCTILAVSEQVTLDPEGKATDVQVHLEAQWDHPEPGSDSQELRFHVPRNGHWALVGRDEQGAEVVRTLVGYHAQDVFVCAPLDERTDVPQG